MGWKKILAKKVEKPLESLQQLTGNVLNTSNTGSGNQASGIHSMVTKFEQKMSELLAQSSSPASPQLAGAEYGHQFEAQAAAAYSNPFALAGVPPNPSAGPSYFTGAAPHGTDTAQNAYLQANSWNVNQTQTADTSHNAPPAASLGSNAADYGPKPVSGSKPASTLISKHVLDETRVRQYAARSSLGDEAFGEACKGLSRVLRPGDPNDLYNFAAQLRASDRAATALDDYETGKQEIVFALSYVQHHDDYGRFKFSAEQWDNFMVSMQELSRCGVTHMRLWYDQCLWLRDASQRSWAHIGILPYAIWPVVSLGTKRSATADRTLATYERFWPFVEEVSALWGMGLLITKELRSPDATHDNSRCALSYNVRWELEPASALSIVLLNIFHGAADGLKTGWIQDVAELKEMASWNVMYGDGQSLVMGADWKTRLGSQQANNMMTALNKLLMTQKPVDTSLLPYMAAALGTTVEQMSQVLYLDGARKVVHQTRWDGIYEFFSGNFVPNAADPSSTTLPSYLLPNTTWYNVVTDKGEYQLVCVSEKRTVLNQSIWLLVAMDGRSYRYTRGTIAWVKVVHGRNSCFLGLAISQNNVAFVATVIAEQLPCESVHITSMANVSNQTPEWSGHA